MTDLGTAPRVLYRRTASRRMDGASWAELSIEAGQHGLTRPHHLRPLDLGKTVESLLVAFGRCAVMERR